MKQVTLIDVNEWDDLVSNIYGIPYSFQQQDGCKPRGVYTFSVPIKHPYDYPNNTLEYKCQQGNAVGAFLNTGVSFHAWKNKDLHKVFFNPDIDEWYKELLLRRNCYPAVDMIINDLYSKGLLKAGEYAINIDW